MYIASYRELDIKKSQNNFEPKKLGHVQIIEI